VIRINPLVQVTVTAPAQCRSILSIYGPACQSFIRNFPYGSAWNRSRHGLPSIITASPRDTLQS